MSTLPSGAYAADEPTLSETFVLTKDGQLVDTLTTIDPSRTMSESACQPYVGTSSDQHVELVTRDDATVCHMQLMYTNAENKSEFSLEDSGGFVMTTHAERTLTESRKLFHPDLTLQSLSLSVEGEVQSSTAATTNALKDPWDATPMPASASASPSAAPTADAGAAPESSDPPIALVVSLIVGLILLVIGIVIGVHVVRAKRGKKAASITQGAASASHGRRPAPSRGSEGVELYAPPAPIPPTSAPTPTAPSVPAASSTERPSASLNPPPPTPRDTGFTWEHKSRPKPTASPSAASAEAPKKRRSRKDHRPAVFPERTATPVAPPVPPQAPILTPTPSITSTPTQVSEPVVPAPQAQVPIPVPPVPPHPASAIDAPETMADPEGTPGCHPDARTGRGG